MRGEKQGMVRYGPVRRARAGAGGSRTGWCGKCGGSLWEKSGAGSASVSIGVGWLGKDRSGLHCKVRPGIGEAPVRRASLRVCWTWSRGLSHCCNYLAAAAIDDLPRLTGLPLASTSTASKRPKPRVRLAPIPQYKPASVMYLMMSRSSTTLPGM